MKHTHIIQIKILPILSILAISHLAKAETNNADIETWQWRLSAGQLHQEYYEVDKSGLIADGVLNSETGNIPTINLSITNTLNNIKTKTVNNKWTPYSKLGIHYASGESDYDGYLQYGSTFTPYRAKTNNQILQTNLDFGASKKWGSGIVITPNLAITHHRWKRDLKQYTEKFRHTAVLAGANVNWQPSHSVPLTLQATGQAGKLVDSKIDVPKLGLNQNIGNAGIWRIGINGNYKIANNLSLNAGISHEQWAYKQSDTENGYLYPDSESEQTVWQIGFGYEF